MTAVTIAALVVAALVLRTALVEAYGSTNPGKVAALWSGHPAVILESGLAKVGDAAAAGEQIPPSLIDPLLAASRKAPLSPHPFLVRGVEGQLAGNDELARRAFLAARQRNPRNIAARYFLADQYLKTNNTREGLAEISALARLVPQSLPNIAPYLAAYARMPNAAPQVKAIIGRQPQLEAALLTTLAADARNRDLILNLWSGRGGEKAREWQSRLVNSLVAGGNYAAARNAWTRFSGMAVRSDRLIDPDFAGTALPPFGWTLASGPAGVADPEGRGQLHILYYGRDDLVLASQLLTLPPGRYRLSMRVKQGSPAARSLAWTVRCLPPNSELAVVRLGDRSGVVGTGFGVPAGCSAQRLELAGDAPEFPEQADVTIGQLRLEPERG